MLDGLAVPKADDVHMILAHGASGRGHPHQGSLVGATHGQSVRSGRWLTLQGALTEAKPGSPSRKMIAIEPTGPREVAWLKADAYVLSPREREIVDLVLRGASRTQIAATLYISEYTVQDHLSNVFDKVGVRGRERLS